MAEPLTDEQAVLLQTSLGSILRVSNRMMFAMLDQTLLVQTLANAKALHAATSRMSEVIDSISVETQCRYITRPEGESIKIVDLNSFRAPTDLRGLEA